MNIRARRDEDKQTRRNTILAASLAVWSDTDWNDFTMAAVARRAGIVKGTIYLYFATKEELFLALFQNMMLEYFDEIDALLAGGRRWSPSRVAATIADALLSRPAFARMFTVLGSILEHNISYQSAVEFKRFTLDRFTSTGTLLARRLGLRSPGEGLRLMLQLTALITGLAQMSHPAPVLEQVFKDKRLSVLRVDFRRELLDALETLFRGVERRKK